MADAAGQAPPEAASAAPAAQAPAEAAAQGGAEAAAPAPAAAEEPAKDAVAPVIVIKKVMDDGHGGAHGGAWKIALADMMTAMMAFFLLMWLLGATNADQRKSIADYFKPTSHSNVTMGKLAGSNGILGGRSIIDPDGFPFSTKQTAALERVTPKSEGGPTENDPNPNSTERSDPSDPSKMSEEQKKAVAEQQDQAARPGRQPQRARTQGVHLGEMDSRVGPVSMRLQVARGLVERGECLHERMRGGVRRVVAPREPVKRRAHGFCLLERC